MAQMGKLRPERTTWTPESFQDRVPVVPCLSPWPHFLPLSTACWWSLRLRTVTGNSEDTVRHTVGLPGGFGWPDLISHLYNRPSMPLVTPGVGGVGWGGEGSVGRSRRTRALSE